MYEYDKCLRLINLFRLLLHFLTWTNRKFERKHLKSKEHKLVFMNISRNKLPPETNVSTWSNDSHFTQQQKSYGDSIWNVLVCKNYIPIVNSDSNVYKKDI